MSQEVSVLRGRDVTDLHREQLLQGPEGAGQQGHGRGPGPRHHKALRSD